MRIQEVTDLDLLKAYHQVEAAAYDHDYVALPADGIEELLPLVEGHQPAGETVRMWVAYDGDVAAATLSMSLPKLDNVTAAHAELQVHPGQRRRGHAREMLAFALEQVHAAGRSRAFVESPGAPGEDEGPGFALLRSFGARPVLVDVRRLLDLHAFPVGEVPEPPVGYRLVRWVDRAPEDLLDGLAYMLHRMVLDAPMGEMDYEAEAWDAQRYREAEASAQRRQRTRLVTAAVHEATGAVAGVTEIGKSVQRHDVAFQWNTIVDPAHRGHGLGKVLKSWNHEQLVAREPTLRWVNTWNAATNTYMIAVNEALGYRPVEPWTEWQLDL